MKRSQLPDRGPSVQFSLVFRVHVVLIILSVPSGLSHPWLLFELLGEALRHCASAVSRVDWLLLRLRLIWNVHIPIGVDLGLARVDESLKKFKCAFVLPGSLLCLLESPGQLFDLSSMLVHALLSDPLLLPLLLNFYFCASSLRSNLEEVGSGALGL